MMIMEVRLKFFAHLSSIYSREILNPFFCSNFPWKLFVDLRFRFSICLRVDTGKLSKKL